MNDDLRQQLHRSSLDDVARTSDDDAVQARFNAATLTALRVVCIMLIVFALPRFGGAKTVFRVALAIGTLAFSIVTLFAVRKKATGRLAEFTRRRARGAAMVFTIVQLMCLVAYTASGGNRGQVLSYAILIPVFVVSFRLLPAEHVLLHSVLAAVPLIAVLMMPLKEQTLTQVLIPPIIVNAGALVMALAISRRKRKTIIAEWTERRTSAREQIRMRDELRYARELQLSMLPESAPHLEWADISSISIPASEVGGDYYDYFVQDERVALVCGDVAGHGMASGLVLSALRGGFALLRDSLQNPAAVLARLHDVVTHTTRRRMLVTVSFVLVDRGAKRITIASAGHPPVIVRHEDGSTRTVDLYAPPLGVKLPMNIPQRDFPFVPGEVLVLHSDGIYETRNAAGESYGFDRLQSVVGQHGGGTAETLRDAILRDVAEFRGAIEQDDDITIVVCRLTGALEPA